jgi:hypothetical protein
MMKAALIVALLLLLGVLAARTASWYQTGDFLCLYEGGRALATGHDPYDEAWWQSATGGTYPHPLPRGGEGPSACPGRYGYPLWTAALVLPLAVLPLEVAASLWAALMIGGTLLGMRAAWRAVGGPVRLAPVFAAIVVTSQPFFVLLIVGQLGGLLLGLAGLLALSLARRQERASGALLASLLVKPQVVVLALPALLIRLRARRRALVGAAAALVAMTVVPMLFVPRWPFEWVDELLVRRLRVTGLLPTAWGLAADVFGNAALGAFLVAAVIAATWLIARGRVDDVALLALTLPLSLFATPYAWSYDHLVLGVSWALVLARAEIAGAWPRLWLTVATIVVATFAPWALYALAFTRGGETLTAVVPALTALLVAFALRASTPIAARPRV